MIPDRLAIFISMHACPYEGCDYRTLQKSNVQTHIRTHTRERSKTCPHSECPFCTTDPGSLTRHRKSEHGYKPKARRIPDDKAARKDAAAPYPTTRIAKPEVVIPASLNLIDLTFLEYTGLMPCGALSPSESSDSQFSGEFTVLTLDRLVPNLSAEKSISLCGQPSQLPVPTPNYFQLSTVPTDLSTVHIEPQLLSDTARPHVHDFGLLSQSQPISYEDLQPVSGTDVNNKLPVELEELLQKYGSRSFEGRCEYPKNAPYLMAEPSFTNEHNGIKIFVLTFHAVVKLLVHQHHNCRWNLELSLLGIYLYHTTCIFCTYYHLEITGCTSVHESHDYKLICSFEPERDYQITWLQNHTQVIKWCLDITTTATRVRDARCQHVSLSHAIALSTLFSYISHLYFFISLSLLPLSLTV